MATVWGAGEDEAQMMDSNLHEPKEKNMDEIADVIETLDNLVAAMSLPISAETHLEAMRGSLPEQRDKLKAAYLALGGEDYWS